MNEVFETLGKKFPFLSLIRKGELEYIGIISNQDNQVTSFYDYGRIMLPEDKMKYLKLGETWWWESNRKIPINLFIGKEFDIMKSCLRTYSVKESIVEFGPIVSLSDLTLNKRYRKKTVQLIRRVD